LETLKNEKDTQLNEEFHVGPEVRIGVIPRVPRRLELSEPLSKGREPHE